MFHSDMQVTTLIVTVHKVRTQSLTQMLGKCQFVHPSCSDCSQSAENTSKLQNTTHSERYTDTYTHVRVCQLHSLKVATGEKEPRPGAWTHSLRPNAERQPCKPPMWPRFFVHNRHIYTVLGSFSPVATFKLCSWQTQTCYTPACITLTDYMHTCIHQCTVHTHNYILPLLHIIIILLIYQVHTPMQRMKAQKCMELCLQ